MSNGVPGTWLKIFKLTRGNATAHFLVINMAITDSMFCAGQTLFPILMSPCELSKKCVTRARNMLIWVKHSAPDSSVHKFISTDS